ncbi:hypothetical protein ACLNGM_14925 [Aureimonas phyllosphaerae]
MIFAALTFTGALALGVSLGRFLTHRKPMDAAVAVLGLTLIAVAPLAPPS